MSWSKSILNELKYSRILYFIEERFTSFVNTHTSSFNSLTLFTHSTHVFLLVAIRGLTHKGKKTYLYRKKVMKSKKEEVLMIDQIQFCCYCCFGCCKWKHFGEI